MARLPGKLPYFVRLDRVKLVGVCIGNVDVELYYFFKYLRIKIEINGNRMSATGKLKASR